MPKGEYLQYGGQAVIEGVMMRSPRFFAVACRAPNQEIVVQAEPIESTWIGRQKWLKKPFLRGVLALLDALVLGLRSLQFASQVQLDESKAGDGPPKSERVRSTTGKLLFWIVFLAINAVVAWFLVPVVGGAMVAKAGQVWQWVSSPRGMIVLGVGVILVAWMVASAARSGRKQDPEGSINEIAVGGAMTLGLAFGIVLFVIIPTAAVDAFKAYGWEVWQLNLLDVVLRLFIFLDYIALIGQVPDLYRVFQYHGAEHKAINTLEADQELTAENAARQTRIHPRCGTSFVVIVVLLSIAVFPFLPRPALWLRIPLHLAILFPIASVAYEALRLAGKFRGRALATLAFWPGMLTQFLTTREPNERQVEVALHSLKAVMAKEEAREEPVPV
jgi:uncharacterized protein YqhQ